MSTIIGDIVTLGGGGLELVANVADGATVTATLGSETVTGVSVVSTPTAVPTMATPSMLVACPPLSRYNIWITFVLIVRNNCVILY